MNDPKAAAAYHPQQPGEQVSTQGQHLSTYLDSVAEIVNGTRIGEEEKIEILTAFMSKFGFEKDRTETLVSYSHGEMNAGVELKLVGDDLVIEFRYGPEVDYRSIPTALNQVGEGLVPIFDKLEQENDK